MNCRLGSGACSVLASAFDACAGPGLAHHTVVNAPVDSANASAKALRRWRRLALVLAALIAALAFGAYTQPELLLNYSGLRYCG